MSHIPNNVKIVALGCNHTLLFGVDLDFVEGYWKLSIRAPKGGRSVRVVGNHSLLHATEELDIVTP